MLLRLVRLVWFKNVGHAMCMTLTKRWYERPSTSIYRLARWSSHWM